MPKYKVGDTVYLNPNQMITDEWPSFSTEMHADAINGIEFVIGQIIGVSTYRPTYYRLRGSAHNWAVLEKWIVPNKPKRKPFTKMSRRY
jgi:hypothetical protein